MMRPDLPAVACVLGPGGIGKSNLCLSALHAEEVKKKFEEFGRRRAFVRCDAATGRESLVKFIAEEIGVEIGPNLEDRVLDELERSPAVVVLDNFESPWEREQGEVEAFLSVLAGIEHLALVVGVRGQQRPGGIAYGEVIEIETLSPEHAAEVFLNVAGKKFAADPALQPLLREMDYLPLAVELLAYRAQTETSLSRLEKSWREKKSEILKRANAKDRQTNLAASVELSFESPRMTEDAKKLASLLGVLPNGISDEDLPAILGNEGDEAARVLRAVGLAFSEDRRIRVLAPIRSYLAQFHFPDDSPALKPAMEHFVEMGTTLGGRAGRPGGAEAVQKVVADYENIVTMIKFLLITDDWKSGTAAACGMAEFIRFTGFGDSIVLTFAENTARLRGDSAEQANCIKSLGDIALDRSDHTEARVRYEEARPLFERVDDVLGQANCIKRLGDIALRRSDHVEARARYEEARSLYERVGDVLGQANCIASLGDIALDRSDHVEARARYEEARPLYEHVGSVLGQANCIRSLGDIALDRSDHVEARARYEDAKVQYECVGDVLGQSNCIKRLGDVALRRSDYGEAQLRYEEAKVLYERVGSVLGKANCIRSLGDIALRRWNNVEAQLRFEEARGLYESIGDVLGQGNYIRSLGEIAMRRLNHLEARLRFEEARMLYECIGDVLGQANCIRSLGDIARIQGILTEAREKYFEAVELYNRIPEPYSIGQTCYALAFVSGRRERIKFIDAARRQWESIDRRDLVAQLRWIGPKIFFARFLFWLLRSLPNYKPAF